MSKRYEVYIHGEIKSTVVVYAEDKHQAINEAEMELGTDNTIDYSVREIKPSKEEIVDVLVRSTDKVEINALLEAYKEGKINE
jgi:hypothetical protein